MWLGWEESVWGVIIKFCDRSCEGYGGEEYGWEELVWK